MTIQSRVVKQNYTNKSKTMKKVHRRKSPEGDGEWAPSERAYSKIFIMVFTMLEMAADGPYRFGSKGLQVFRKRQDQEWCSGRSLNNVNPWFSDSTSPCPGDKNEKPATCNASNVPNKALRT